MELEHRRWMYNRNYSNRELREEFIEGVAGFIAWAKILYEFLTGGMIRCPCVKCKCDKFLKPEDIKDHLYKKGFMKNYFVWIFHGEIDANPGVVDFQKTFSGESSPFVEKNFKNSRFNKMVKDAYGMYSGVQSQPSVVAKRFYEHLEEASHPLYEGSMHSKLSIAHRLLFIKSHWNVSVAAIDYIIGLMNELDPNKIGLPNNYYTAKKLVPNHGEVGALDGLQRLIIAPDGTTGFFPNTLSTSVVMDCIIPFYRDAWITWREIERPDVELL
ncbi:uncharacterized protein [Nicotiana tomentosiformis]|uniref:uncharacterized protein n=1 Tax=Nicotiana tomentosiformis TaxID=4098 RepID=UPI000878CB83|nr:uncharacterized protein LOC108948315 [Nicotiana tomentosiformis]